MLSAIPINIAIERAIEAVLVLDPETRQQLDRLDGKHIRFVVSAPSVSLTLSINDGQVLVVDLSEDDIDTTIRGSAAALRSLMTGNQALYRGEVQIEGDLTTGKRLKEILSNVDPDWEEALSPWLGDALAHRLGRLGRQLDDWVRRSHREMAANTRDYLQEEAELLVGKRQVRDFLDAVDELRSATDRLAARVRRLEASGCPDSTADNEPSARDADSSTRSTRARFDASSGEGSGEGSDEDAGDDPDENAKSVSEQGE